jgi:hypothetical protein
MNISMFMLYMASLLGKGQRRKGEKGKLDFVHVIII